MQAEDAMRLQQLLDQKSWRTDFSGGVLDAWLALYTFVTLLRRV
jgi:hypothetical protein